jgi:hypothetical protein
MVSATASLCARIMTSFVAGITTPAIILARRPRRGVTCRSIW